ENHKKYVATGIAIADDMILTSTLITTRAYDKIYIKTINGKQYNADIIGRDSKHAIILLKLKEKVLTPMRRSYELEVGDWIALVGVFYNKFPSIFQGIVSSLTEKEMILNAPVFPGASGGAVVNKKGELVAVIRGRLRIAMEPDISIIDHKGELILHSPKLRNKNLCYAVPIKKVMEIANQIKEYGHVKRGWLGIYIRSDKTGREAKITYVVKGSPAESAGLQKYDIVISINGKKIKKYSDVSRIIHSIHPGKKVKINVLRNQVPKTIRVQIGEVQPKKYYEFGNFRITLPRSPMIIPEFDGTFPQAKNFTLYRKGSKKLGVDVIEITTGLAKKFKIKEGYGLMISKVYEKSSAEKAGFSEGDIIIQANKKPLKTFTDIRNTLNELNEKEPIKLVFYRDGKRRSMNMIPDIINDEFVDWNEFLSRSDIFS
ncbi:PDZ domain-containing protein, partial [bacterium]|nr:PDZ domain-containing protein [bacterium]